VFEPRPLTLSSNPIPALVNCLKVFANQWCPPEKLLSIQTRKLKRLVRTAYRNVGYYRRMFDQCGLSPARIQTIEDLSRIPITTKTDLQLHSTDELLHKGLAPESLASERSSGSTGQPFRVYYDRTYRSIRNLLFLRGLIAAGYRFGQKVQLVTGEGKKDKRLLRWHYSSILDPPEQLLAELNREKPDLLYGCKTPLVRLAEHIRDTNAKAHMPKRIVSTAELLSPESRALLEQVFSVKVFDFYGSTEMGLVGWECGAGGGYHLSADSVILELLPMPGNSGLARMVMTNLDLKAMPLIRYDSGDLGVAGPAGRCRCGRLLPKLQRVEGRQNDGIRARDGRTISPYQLTCAMEKIPGIFKYQVIQTDWDDFTIRVSIKEKEELETRALIQQTLRSVLGDAIRLDFDFGLATEHQAGRKFRAVKSMVTGA
jgi:phenylacetate-CoA ligase